MIIKDRLRQESGILPWGAQVILYLPSEVCMIWIGLHLRIIIIILPFLTYTPAHLVESIENCRLWMRWCLACSRYGNVVYCALATMRMLCYKASAMQALNVAQLHATTSSTLMHRLLVYWLDEMNRSITLKALSVILNSKLHFFSETLKF